MLLRMALFFLNYPVRISQKSCRATVTEVYAHILDEERKINAQKFEVAFYANPDMRRVEQELNPPKPEPAPDLNLQSLLAQLQENPELARQLKALLHAG